jgi:hypothetical protein
MLCQKYQPLFNIGIMDHIMLYATRKGGSRRLLIGGTVYPLNLWDSLSRVEGFLGYISWPTWAAVEGERLLRQEFWRAYWDGVIIGENDLQLRQKVKTVKDIGFVVDTVRGCSCSDDVNPYQLLKLEGILMLSSVDMLAEPALGKVDY